MLQGKFDNSASEIPKFYTWDEVKDRAGIYRRIRSDGEESRGLVFVSFGFGDAKNVAITADGGGFVGASDATYEEDKFVIYIKPVTIQDK